MDAESSKPGNAKTPDAADESTDRKAELRARLFSSEANDVEIPIPPKPPEPKPENDASLLMFVAIGFFVLGIVCLGASRVIQVDGVGLNPFEVMTLVSLAASGVIGMWWQIKAHRLKFQFIPPDEE